MYNHDVKFNTVFGTWEWMYPNMKHNGLIHLGRKWKTVVEVLMENEVKKYMRKLVLQ